MDPAARRLRAANQKPRSSWHGTAFIIEAIVLLAFLVGSVALFMQLFANASSKGAENENLAHAIVLASNSAERFAVEPTGVADETETEDGFQVTCTVTAEETGGGTLYRADIVVSMGEDELYGLQTAKYVSEAIR